MTEREEAIGRAYPCPHCCFRQRYAEREYPHHCRQCGKRIVWYCVLGRIEYGWRAKA